MFHKKIKEAEAMHALTGYDTTQDMQLTNLMYRGPQLEAYLLADSLDPPHHTLLMREEEDISSYIPLVQGNWSFTFRQQCDIIMYVCWKAKMNLETHTGYIYNQIVLNV